MKNVILAFFSLLTFGLTFAQNTPNLPVNTSGQPSFENLSPKFRAPGDSCGAYFNNYFGLAKTSNANVEYIRKGNGVEDYWYGGLAQRYHCPQAMEISGVKFYAYDTSAAVDSIMAIAILHDWDDVNDSLGVELARDTVYVTHQAFDLQAENIAVVAMFDNPVTVSDQYMILIENPTDDSMGVMVSDPSNFDGQGEGLAFHYYNNNTWPSYIGSYHNLTHPWFGAAWDYDALISPLVDFELQNGFTITDDEICPNIVSAGCVDYSQLAVYADSHYNANYASPEQEIIWTWGDGLQNSQLYNACHTYTSSGTFDITLSDMISRYDANSASCGFSKSLPITVLDSATADFTWANNTTWVTFTNNSTLADSVLWNFGDSTFSTSWDTHHVYDTVGTYDVTLIAYGECGNDTLTVTVTTDNVGIEDYDFNFSFYPNPANNNVYVSGLLEGTRVEILNILGETVLLENPTSSTMILPTNNLSNGTYFVRVSTDYGQVTKKLMVRH